MKIALINVRFSPNFGDGLLAECLEAELAREMPEASFVSVDLAGRTGYGHGPRWRRMAMQTLMAAPAPLRRVASRFALQHISAKLEQGFARALADCDAAVLGGGNLLADIDLNFPVKISKALAAYGGDRPVAIFAVGVSHNWSAEGASLFRTAFDQARLVHVSVRDGNSHRALQAQAPQLQGHEIAVVRDPGLLAAHNYAARPAGHDRVIGLCVTDPLALRYHGGTANSDAVRDWFGGIAAQLAAAGHRVTLFTNGGQEDRHFLASNAAAWCAPYPHRITVAPEPERPADLVGTIAGCALVIAHRMHACIAAHSFGVPTIGLRWDPKLEAFFAIADRSDYLFTAGEDPVEQVVASAEQALADGIDRDAHTALLAHARGDVATLAAKLRAAVRHGT